MPQTSMELVEHIGGDQKAIYVVDGHRVSEGYYRALDEAAARRDCFHTSARQMPGGKFRRTNRKMVYL